jgi:hypothetical protein
MSSGDHVKMWTAEKAVSILNFPAIILPFIYTTPLTDAFFCTVLVLHWHWGELSTRKSCQMAYLKTKIPI